MKTLIRLFTAAPKNTSQGLSLIAHDASKRRPRLRFNQAEAAWRANQCRLQAAIVLMMLAMFQLPIWTEGSPAAGSLGPYDKGASGLIAFPGVAELPSERSTEWMSRLDD